MMFVKLVAGYSRPQETKVPTTNIFEKRLKKNASVAGCLGNLRQSYSIQSQVEIIRCLNGHTGLLEAEGVDRSEVKLD